MFFIKISHLKFLPFFFIILKTIYINIETLKNNLNLVTCVYFICHKIINYQYDFEKLKNKNEN